MKEVKERVASFRERMKKSGMVRREVYIPKKDIAKLNDFARELREAHNEK